MAIPDFQTLMRPTLELHQDHLDHARAPLRDRLANLFNLSDEERAQLLPSGNQRRFDNRLAWTITHLAQAGLLARPRRGVTRLTERGASVLANHPERVDMGILNQYPEYLAFRGPRADTPSPKRQPGATEAKDTPEEQIQAAFEEINDALAEELLQKTLACDPDFFEQLIIDVLIAMGYGGSKAQAGERLGRSGDEGIDGVIMEDQLGLDVIYLQAKRWALDRTVGAPEIQRFAGALQGAQASKGVFITTAHFSRQASEYAAKISTRVVLVDGRQLARLMIAHGVGVTVRDTYALKRADEDYFTSGLGGGS